MTSAALDACLCLLLVSAAAVTVTSAPDATPGTDRADAVAERLAAETASVEYTLRPAEANRSAAGPEYERTTHGTLASLLARAAVSTVRVDDEPMTRTRAGFADAVVETVERRLPGRTQVVVEFRPYPGSELGRVMTVGPTPPGDADVHAATVRAPSGVPAVESPAETAAGAGFDGLADAVAAKLVRGLFPPAKGRLALAGDPPVTTLVEHRYARASRLYGVRTADAVRQGETRAANRRLMGAVATRVRAELRDHFDSPEAAAGTLRLGDVKLSIRTWSP